MNNVEWLEAEAILHDIGVTLKAAMPNGIGFALLIFNFEAKRRVTDERMTAYISNARREDMIDALRECANRIEGMK